MDDSDEECFVPAKWDEESTQVPQLPVSINDLISSANDLHDKTRPSTIAARTCFVQLNLRKIPEALESSYIDQQGSQRGNERKNSSIFITEEAEDMFKFLNNHKLIYNKISAYRQTAFPLEENTSRFKPIKGLTDFHTKIVNELSEPSDLPIDNPFKRDYFDSHFECGNLAQVYMREYSREYFLLLEKDINSHGYTSWFFFKVKPFRQGTATFHVINLAKSPSLYRAGMKIAIFSKKSNAEKKTGWFWGGQNIEVGRTRFPKKMKSGENYSSLSFEYEFADEDEVHFALCQPYTYTRMEKSLSIVQEKLIENLYQVNVVKSVYSICHNIIPILEIKEKTKSQTKKVIVFMARQHPAEVVGSFLMQSLLGILGSNSGSVRELLAKFNLVIIPMVNPDGVIHGNSRCNLAGLDLNRNWSENQEKGMSPECQGLRKYLWDILQTNGIEFLVDLHGHSKKLNSFFFSSRPSEREPNYFFPFLVSQIEPIYDFSSCTFSSTSDKRNTLRLQMMNEGILNCITLESSYYGYRVDKDTTKPFRKDDYDRMAESLFEAIKLSSLYKESEAIQMIGNRFRIQSENIFCEMNKAIEKSRQLTRKISYDAQLQSDSDPEGDIIDEKQVEKLFQEEKIGTTEKELKLKRKKKTLPVQNYEKNEWQIRRSQPNPNKTSFKMNETEKKTLNKTHGSEKKIVLPQKIKEKPMNTQTKFYSHHKPKKEQILQKFEKKVPMKQLTIGNPIKELSNIKAKGAYSLASRHSSFEQNEQSTRIRRQKQRAEISQLVENKKIKKEEKQANTISQSYVEKNVEDLTQTLSICKINRNSCELENEKSVDEGDVLEQNFRQKTEADEKRKEIIHRQYRKRIMGGNYQKQIMKRKKILLNSTGKYKRFQNFVSGQNNMTVTAMKPEVNSVFYYFPIKNETSSHFSRP